MIEIEKKMLKNCEKRSETIRHLELSFNEKGE
jgi:hypothetical protein